MCFVENDCVLFFHVLCVTCVTADRLGKDNVVNGKDLDPL